MIRSKIPKQKSHPGWGGFFVLSWDGFLEGDGDFLVVRQVFRGEYAAGMRMLAAFGLPVFQPFLAHLVAPDVEVPHFLRHAAEAGGFGFSQPDGLVRAGDHLDAEFRGIRNSLRQAKSENAFLWILTIVEDVKNRDYITLDGIED